MKKIENLLEQHGRVWFYIDDDCREDFAQEIASLGILFMNGDPVLPSSITRTMGVDRSSIGYISNLVWYMSFQSKDSPIKINYKKYVSGDMGYIYFEPNIVPANIAPVNIASSHIQYTAEDILNAKEVHLYNNEVLYIVDQQDNAYGFSKQAKKWYYKDNFWEYFESSMMLSCFSAISKDDAVGLFLEWSEKGKANA